MKARKGRNERKVEYLSIDGSALVADSAEKLRLVSEFEKVCARRILKISVNKSKIKKCSTSERHKLHE